MADYVYPSPRLMRIWDRYVRATQARDDAPGDLIDSYIAYDAEGMAEAVLMIAYTRALFGWWRSLVTLIDNGDTTLEEAVVEARRAAQKRIIECPALPRPQDDRLPDSPAQPHIGVIHVFEVDLQAAYTFLADTSDLVSDPEESAVAHP